MTKEIGKFLQVEVMEDFTDLELDNLRHEIENLVGVYSVRHISEKIESTLLCPECGEPFDFCAMGHYNQAVKTPNIWAADRV